MGSDESHFNVSELRRAKSQDSVHRPAFEEKREPKQIRTEVPLLTKPAHVDEFPQVTLYYAEHFQDVDFMVVECSF